MTCKLLATIFVICNLASIGAKFGEYRMQRRKQRRLQQCFFVPFESLCHHIASR